jgi:Holliday junction DNA helicase RuvA
MIAYLKGILAARDATQAVVDVGGVGYAVAMATGSLAALGTVGSAVCVYTHMLVRDDGVALYGFASPGERELFERLITVSGVGPKVALSALSAFNAPELAAIITAGDVARVATISGIGKKTAQRIVLELKGVLANENESAGAEGGNASAVSEAESALMNMGFTSEEAALACKGYEGDMSDVGALVRHALQRLGA